MLDDSDREELKNILYKFIDRHCIFRCDPNVEYCPGLPKGTIPPANPGKPSKWQFYMRNLTQDSDMVASATLLIMDMISRNGDLSEEFQFAGLETSSIPLISALQMQCRRFLGKSINYISIRKERKGYGLFNFIDGIPNRSRVCVVDDIVNSASSLNRVADTCNFELDLLLHRNSYFIVSKNKEQIKHIYDGTVTNINSIFTRDEFDLEYSEEKYWVPFDCDKSFNKRPDYR